MKLSGIKKSQYGPLKENVSKALGINKQMVTILDKILCFDLIISICDLIADSMDFKWSVFYIYLRRKIIDSLP